MQPWKNADAIVPKVEFFGKTNIANSSRTFKQYGGLRKLTLLFDRVAVSTYQNYIIDLNRIHSLS